MAAYSVVVSALTLTNVPGT